MCCFFLALMFFGPRFGFLIYWLLAPLKVNLAFTGLNFPWLVGIAGLVFAPWTILMYVFSYPLGRGRRKIPCLSLSGYLV